jgi:flavin reductase (DIM6/NTAB) family NADH-FMN oxidoreductase RutF
MPDLVKAHEFRTALGNLDCSVVSAYEAGDHTIIVGEVREVTVAEGAPLLYFRGRYHMCAVAQEP